jgi:hypothetical protein
MLSSNVFKLNPPQRKELSKAIFNLGNIIIGSLVVNQAVIGTLDFETFIFSVFCFALSWYGAIVLLEERISI